MTTQQSDALPKGMFEEFLRDVVKLGLLFAPPVTLVVTLFFQSFDSFADFIQNFLISLYIGEVVLIFCLSMSYLLATGEEWFFLSLKKNPPTHSDLFHSIRSVIFILPGLFIAFNTMQMIAPIFGIEFAAPSIGQYKFGIAVGIGSIGFGVLLSLYAIKKTSESTIQKLEKEHLNAKVSALSAQMNPHLLFNALNTVAATIQDDPEAAEKMTVDLAGLYRKTLEATRTDFYSIKEELELVQAYLTIEKARFGDRLEFHIAVDDQSLTSMRIPALLIQPLVENAVKHGISSIEKGGTVYIDVSSHGESILIVVEDTGIGFNKSRVKGTGTGLDNSRKRLQLLYPGKSSIEITESAKAEVTSGTKVLVSFPKQTIG